MSMENVKKFMELVQTEEGLAKRMVALKDGLQEGEFSFKNDKEFVEKEILPLAKEYGIEFSVEDFMEFTSSQLTSLSEEDLADVSGGFPGLGLLIGLSVFLGGAATPTIASKAVSYFTGGGTSVTQSVSTTDVNKASESDTAQTEGETKAIASGTEQTEDSKQKREIDKNFKNFVSQKKKELKAKLNDGTYLSPAARKDKINDIVNSLGGSTPDGQTITAVYNEVNDDITFKSDKTSQTETYYDKIRTPLYNAQSTNLAQQYDEAYGSGAAQLTRQYDDLSQQLQKKKTSLSQYVSIDQYKQSITISNEIITNLISQLRPYVTGTLDTNTDFNALKEDFIKRDGYWSYGTYYTFATQINLIDQILTQQQNIEKDQKNINDRDALANEINKISLQMQETIEKLHKQAAFNKNMKTEFDYFYGELVKALKEDEDISKLANSANMTEAKTTLANKIKDKADTIIKGKLNKQLLDGCKIEIDQTELMFNIKVHYNGIGWNNSFSVDEFISAKNHDEIVNSESSKKREEIISKIASYVNDTSSSSSELKLAVRSVFEQIGNKTVDLGLGVDITTANNKSITFSFTSGGKTRTTSFGVDAVVDKCKQLKNMQAMEATRQQNEGTIAYTPFGRKIWNSIGSQAQHVLNTINKIQSLNDVKESSTFENDLKYVADRILIQGETPCGLKGDHHTDTSLKTEDLKKIQDFASKIKK